MPPWIHQDAGMAHGKETRSSFQLRSVTLVQNDSIDDEFHNLTEDVLEDSFV